MKSLLLIFLLAACGSNPVDIAPDAYVYDCPEEDTHSWNGFHWATDNMTVEIVDRTGHEDYLVKEVVDDWNSFGIPQTLIYTREASGDFPTVIVKTQPGDGWLGLARVFLVDGTREIKGGQVFITPSMRDQYTPDAVRHVMCQEVGHTLGLHHIKFETCMDDCTWTWVQEAHDWIDCINDVERSIPHELDVCQLERLTEVDSLSSFIGEVPDKIFRIP